LVKRERQKILAKINGKETARRSLIFVAFAPKDNPKIAIAILVENGGYGATIADPLQFNDRKIPKKQNYKN
jgi:cell division protein FtsI/penicillin-binding protein 2